MKILDMMLSVISFIMVLQSVYYVNNNEFPHAIYCLVFAFFSAWLSQLKGE